MSDEERHQEQRLIEAMLFAASEPLAEAALRGRLPASCDVAAHLRAIERDFEGRGFVLRCIGGRWSFRTAPDLGPALRTESVVVQKLSRAGVETLSIIAYHQPVTRAEIEDIRGVAVSKGTVDILVAAGWIKPQGRKQVPGRPVLWRTTDAFLDHFGLASLDDLPGLDELKAAGFLDAQPRLGLVGAYGDPESEADESGDGDGEGDDEGDGEGDGGVDEAR